MNWKERIKQARAAAEKAGTDARALSHKIVEVSDKNEATGDLEEQYQKALEDYDKKQKAWKLAEQQAKLDAEVEEFEKPAESFVARLLDDKPVETEADRRLARADSPTERVHLYQEARKQREQLEVQKEQFQAAGVTNINQFRRFSGEVHHDSFISFLRFGSIGAKSVIERHGFKPDEGFRLLMKGSTSQLEGVGPAELQALVSSSGDLGGFLVPDDFRMMVLKDRPGFAVMRSLSRVESTSRQFLIFPFIRSHTGTNDNLYTSDYTGAWKAEGYSTGGSAPPQQNQPKFGQLSIPVHMWAPDVIEVTTTLLEDSGANLDSMIAELIGETLALDEDASFIGGSGVNQPTGLRTGVGDFELTEVNSGDSSAITYDSLVDLHTRLASQYRMQATWLMNSLTLGAVMKLKDTQNDPIFPVNAIPDKLFGRPIEFSEFMPNIAANSNPMIFGAFMYYGIADRQELRVQRLTERFAPNIAILPTARVGGQTLRTAAFRKQKIAA